MFPKRLDFDLSFETFNVSGSLPLTHVARAFGRLEERNREARLRDEIPSLRPCLAVRVVCPCCKASIFKLTSIDRDGELLRACRSCGSEFPVEV